MPGIWMTRFARRLTRQDTFERLISPAIADLQSEAAQGWPRRLRHYSAMMLVLACAILRDFRLDVQTAFDADSWRTVWSRAAVWALVAGLCNGAAMYVLTARTLARLDIPPELMPAALNGAVFRSILPALIGALVVAAYRLKRRNPTSVRAVIAAALVFMAVTPIAGYIATALYEPARAALDQAYRIVRPDLPEAMMVPQRLQALAGMIQTAVFAWLGAALARYRGWPLAFNTTAILTVYVLSNLYLMRWATWMLPSLTSILYATSVIPFNAVTLAALILMMQAIQRPFDRQHAALSR